MRHNIFHPATEEQQFAATKMAKLFDDVFGDDEEVGGVNLKVNEEYARRFEYNKKREELSRCTFSILKDAPCRCSSPIADNDAVEEKFKARAANGEDNDHGESESESSDSEEEDEDAFLVTEEVDAEIAATLQAIKNKDPRIYDKDAKFFNALDKVVQDGGAPKEKKEKPVFLRDYHRERYLAGDIGANDEEEEMADAPPRTHVQEQADLKNDILKEINAAAEDDDESEDDAFIKVKSRQVTALAENGVHPSRKERVTAADLDVANADRDPETFLSNFMAARAWIPESGSKWEAFESDDGEDNDDADEFEAAYNLRFEDPAKSNEVLKSYSRKVVEARTVRREEATGRKRQRELEKERKEEEKRERHEQRARLKRLKVEEAEEKLRKIKKAAGMSGKELKEDEWMKLLEGTWENGKWEEEMSRRFGDQYYAEVDNGADDSDDDGNSKSKKKKPKKPTWDDDIDIKDIIPDFEDEEAKPTISLSDVESEAEAEVEAEEMDVDFDDDDEEESGRPSKKRKTTKDLKNERIAAKRASRQERSKIESLVDAQMELDDPTVLARASSSKRKSKGTETGPFRYRETSPTSYGLTPRDILLAPSDAALNDFVGIKKLATFRDAEKKKKDKKKLGKKARLREWRRDVFGREFEHTGPTFGFGNVADGEDADAAVNQKANEVATAGEGKKKRKRSKGKKKAGSEEI